MATTPATLKDLATQVRLLYLDAKADAQAELSAAQAALTAARATQAADTAALVATNAEIAAKQARLAASSDVPVDAAALLEKIAAAQVEARALQAALLDDGDAVAGGEARVAAAQAFLARVSGSYARADAAVKPAAADEARRAGWRAAASAPPLATLAAAANQQLTQGGSDYDDAKQLIAAEVPGELMAAARKGYEVEARRRDRLRASLADIEDELAAREKDDGGPEGEAAYLRLQLARAEAELRAWSERAQDRYDLAVLQLTALASPLFTPAEHDRLNDATPGVPAARTAAVTQRIAREEARAELIEATIDAGDDETLARADDPMGYEGSPPESPPGSPPYDVDAAQAAFDDAEAKYLGRADFAAWSAAVPEPVWRKLVGFAEAEAALNELKDAKPADLADAQQDAEEALAAALWSAERHALSVAYLEEQVNLREGLLSRALSVRQQRLVSALRGDA